MKILHILYIIPILFCMSCNEEEDFSKAAALRVIHGVSDAPSVHVNYIGIETLNFSINPELGYGQDELYTLPANVARDIAFTYSVDTTRQVFNQELTLSPGQISSLFLVGDSANLSGFLLTETFQNYSDSVFGVNFVHAANGLEALQVRVIQTDTAGANDTTLVSSSLSAQSATGFEQYEATGRIEKYTFEYLDASDSVLADYLIDPFDFSAVFRNITVPIIGKPDDGEGNSTLKTIDIDNF